MLILLIVVLILLFGGGGGPRLIRLCFTAQRRLRSASESAAESAT